MSANKKNRLPLSIDENPSLPVVTKEETNMNTESVLVNQPDGTEVLTVDQPDNVKIEKIESPTGEVIVAEKNGKVEAIVLPVVEPKEPTGTTEEVVKIVVPNKVAASELDNYDAALINLVLGSNLLETALQAVKDAPKAKDDMVKASLSQQEELTGQYTQLMAKGIIMPFTPEFEALQAVMVSLHAAKLETERLSNLDVSTIAESSIKALRDSLIRGIEAVRLDVFGKETKNSGKPEGSKKDNKAFVWQREETISYHRYGSFYHVAPLTWTSVEYRQEHDIKVSDTCFMAVNDATGKIDIIISESVKGYSALFAHIDNMLGHDTFDGLTNGTNMTTIGSNESDANKAKFPVLTQEALREKMGDKGNDFTISISEEVGKDDETALPVEDNKEVVTA